MQTKLSRLQKSILSALADSREKIVPVRSLYDPSATNLKAIRATVSKAITRLESRGLVERVSVSTPELKRRKIPAIRSTNTES